MRLKLQQKFLPFLNEKAKHHHFFSTAFSRLINKTCKRILMENMKLYYDDSFSKHLQQHSFFKSTVTNDAFTRNKS